NVTESANGYPLSNSDPAGSSGAGSSAWPNGMQSVWTKLNPNGSQRSQTSIAHTVAATSTLSIQVTAGGKTTGVATSSTNGGPPTVTKTFPSGQQVTDQTQVV